MEINHLEKEQSEFEDWIRKNWTKKHHNFSIKDDGDYYYDAMETAFNVWLGARGWEDVSDL